MSVKHATKAEKSDAAAGSPGAAEFTLRMSAFAKRHGRAKATATKWKGEGLLALDDQGRVKVAESDALLAAAGRIEGASKSAPNSDAAPAPAGADPALDELAERLASGEMLSTPEAERVKQNYLARLRQLEYQRKSEELVDIDAVISEVGRRFNNVRSRLMQLPYQAAPRVAGQDAKTVADLLFADVRDILTELSGRDSDDGGRDVAATALDRDRSS